MKAEDTAIYLFNSAIKKLIILDSNPSKQNAKELCLMDITTIFTAFYNSTIIDQVNINQLKKTFNHYQKVRTIIENI